MVALEARMGLRALSNDMATVETYNQAFSEKAIDADRMLKEIKPLLVLRPAERLWRPCNPGWPPGNPVTRNSANFARPVRTPTKAIVAFIAEKARPITQQIQNAGDDLAKQAEGFLATSGGRE